jgi:hypothetical protein
MRMGLISALGRTRRFGGGTGLSPLTVGSRNKIRCQNQGRFVLSTAKRRLSLFWWTQVFVQPIQRFTRNNLLWHEMTGSLSDMFFVDLGHSGSEQANLGY